MKATLTEDQAIRRIAGVLAEYNETPIPGSEQEIIDEYVPQAKAVWNKMKAIARENPAGPVPAWRNMTREEALRELRIRLEPREPYHFV